MKSFRFAVILMTVCTGWQLPAVLAANPVFTNKPRFRIPYRYDANEMRQLGAQKIHLYLSRNQGQEWRLAQAVQPDAGRFEFQAPSEGEFWFAVRTLDGSNQLYPRGNTLDAGLKVVVDTTSPQLQLDVREARAGQVQLAWQCADQHLDASTLQIEFLQTGGIQWEALNVPAQPNGQTLWEFAKGGIVSVRASVADRAGNVQSAETQARISPSIGLPRQRPLDGPVAMNGNPVNAGPQMAPPNAFPAAPLPPAPAPQGGSNFVSDNAQARPNILRSPYTDAAATPTQQPPKVTNRTRIVSTRDFNVAYKLDDVGPSGVSDIELFITENDGAQWFRYGKDEDRQSPFAVQVPRDGIFGFEIRVRNGRGQVADPPQPGDKPSVVVVVDKTPPAVRLTGASQGQGVNLNQVMINWQVSDDYPADQPVSLAFATDPNGIWEQITGWIPDTGSHVWTVNPTMTSNRVYLRITARDAAGNLSQSIMPDPLLIDLSRPSARIVDVESAGYNGPQR